MSRFELVSPQDWKIHRRIRSERRDRLLFGSAFEEIISQVVQLCTIRRHKRAVIERDRRYFRVEVILDMDPAVVDLFHSSAAGYRAQYFHSIENGEAANKYAVEHMTSRVLDLLKGNEKRTCRRSWVESSLRQPEAKVWISQSSWLRLRKHEDRNLLVERWVEAEWAEDELHKRLWALLTPWEEKGIKLIGGPIDLTGEPYCGNLKPTRSCDLYCRGFTLDACVVDQHVLQLSGSRRRGNRGV